MDGARQAKGGWWWMVRFLRIGSVWFDEPVMEVLLKIS